MTDLNPIIADRFTEHLEVFGKTMEHMDTIQEIGYRCKTAISIMVIRFYSVVMVVLLQILNI